MSLIYSFILFYLLPMLIKNVNSSVHFSRMNEKEENRQKRKVIDERERLGEASSKKGIIHFL